MPTTDHEQLPTKAKSYAALPLGWAALLLYLTLAPADKLPPQPHWQLLSFDTFAHAAFFAVQAALTWFSLRRQRRWPVLARHAGWAVLLGCTAFGAIIEGLQMVLPFNRHGEWSDLISDSLGTAVALGLCYAAAPALQRRGWVLGLAGLLMITGAQAQDMPRVRKTIETLASPQMHGRGYVQQGDKVAAAYLRERLSKLQLQPLALDYAQPFVLNVNTFPAGVALNLNHNPFPQLGPTKRLRPGIDFIVSPASGSGFLTKLHHLLYLDSIIVNNQIEVRAFLLGSQEPCTVVLLDHYVQNAAKLPASIASRLDSVSAVIRIVPKLTASLSPTQVRKQMQLEALPHPLLNTSKADNSLHAYGAEVRVDAQLQRNYQTQNLAAIVRGTAQPDSFLVVSAHYDHLGMMGKNVYFPGANDNASGVAMLLELAAHYAKPENRPACSVVFLLFGAEEAGLVGSQYFVAHPLVPLRNIKFLLNLDLLGSGEQGATVVNGRIHEAAFRRLTALNDAHHYLPALGARGKAANSDHYPFSEAGVPAFYMYLRGASKAYHDVNDTPATLTLAGFQGAFGLVRDFLNELGARPER
ncbi:M20/M25/M40 family metallo-hydrolase [Hymenobacter sp. ASUV-10]|uniref:M20/M25/M40 family metallo-hydrolase n=1 Tax=Hymenobacter aranciens TaxID=3063996 RepID=A0ABT9B4Y3_9BACT|nr:M28 family peptidase [Hymenobacter sp. ASUV-10]MDO7873329.1 M20/M25/M40 family metallo-hydrolase [Hymenobacter sp. ASUV-10]